MKERKPITCKCGKYYGKPYQNKYCRRCKTVVTFKSIYERKEK